MSAGKLPARAAEDIYQKSLSGRTSFIAELTGTGAVSAADLAHTLSTAFGAPLLDLDAIDPQRLPKDLLDAKLCHAYRIVVLEQTQQPSRLLQQPTPRTSRRRRRSSSPPRWVSTGSSRNTTSCPE